MSALITRTAADAHAEDVARVIDRREAADIASRAIRRPAFRSGARYLRELLEDERAAYNVRGTSIDAWTTWEALYGHVRTQARTLAEDMAA